MRSRMVPSDRTTAGLVTLHVEGVATRRNDSSSHETEAGDAMAKKTKKSKEAEKVEALDEAATDAAVPVEQADRCLH